MNEDQEALLKEVQYWIWSGFYDVEEVQAFIGDLFEDDATEAMLRAAVDPEFAKKRAAEQSWPEETDCDRLDAAFADLSDAGIVALHNAGGTMADGINDVAEVLDSLGRDGIHGYCFYHSQDVEDAIDGLWLQIAFGDVNDDPQKSAAVAKTIQRVLEQHGFKVEWDGDIGTRLKIPAFDWKRRLMDLPED
jgi:hypothetical protein